MDDCIDIKEDGYDGTKVSTCCFDIDNVSNDYPFYCFSLIGDLKSSMKAIERKSNNKKVKILSHDNDDEEDEILEEEIDAEELLEDEVTSHWDVIKTHYIYHYRSDIERSGVSSNYCSELFEHMHQKVVKGPVRASNHRPSTTEEYLNKQHENELLSSMIGECVEVDDSEVKETNWIKVYNLVASCVESTP